jgi:hypothetical protein
VKGYIAIAQNNLQNASSSLTIDLSTLAAIGGFCLFIFAAVQVGLKVWENRVSTINSADVLKHENQVKQDQDALKTEAQIQQNQEALTTLVEVFRKGQEADDELQKKSFDAQSQLISQLSAIKANATQQLAETLISRMEAYDRNQLEINDAFRKNTAEIADLGESIKKIDWILESYIKEKEAFNKDFVNGLNDVSKTVNKIESIFDRKIGNAIARTN